jgi:GH24 family phage-related lysozyme (muramidase)
MAQRPQVRQFQAPTQADIRPTASPVDTFVRTVKQPSQPSPLAQFMTAIAPAIETGAEQRKLERLRKEKEIADGIQANKEFQVKLQSRKFLGDLALDYQKNEQNYLGQDQDAVYNGVRGQKQDYIQTLKDSGVGDDIIQIFDQNIELGLETFMGETFRPAKYVHTQGVLLEGFGDGIRQINRELAAGLLTAEEAKQEIANNFTEFHQANNDYFQVNDNKVNDFLVDMSDKLKGSDPFSAVTQYLQDANYSMNQLGKSRYTQQSNNITVKQAAFRTKQFNDNAKATGLAGAIEQFRLDRKGSVFTDVGYTKQDNSFVKYTAKEIEDALFADAKEQGLGLGGQLDMFRDAGITPTKFAAFVNDGATLLVSGDPTTPEGFKKVQQGLQMYVMMKNSGIKMDLTDDQKLRYDLLAFKVFDQADVGTIQIPQYEEEMMTQTGVLTVQDFGNAAMQIQGLDEDRLVKLDKDTRAKVTDALQAGIFTDVFGTDLSETYDTADVEIAVVKAYEALSILGERGTPEELIEKAANIVKADYQIPTSSDGTPYAFKDLNTGMDKALDVASIVTEYNETLAALPKVKKYMLEKFGAKDFVLQVQPDPTNPKNAVIRAFRKQDGQVTEIGIITGKMDKVTLLTDRQQLNNLVANLVIPDDASLATTPDINTLSTSNATVEGQLQQDLSFNQYLLGGAGVEGVPALYDLVGVLDNLGQWFVENPPLFNVDKETGDITLSNDADEAYLSLPQQATNAIIDAAKKAKPYLGSLVKAEGNRTPKEQALVDEIKETTGSLVKGALGIKEAAASTLIADEGFETSPYDDMGKQSVGYGFQIESLEADEKALIEDINNVKPEEADAVLNLKVDKLSNWWDDTVEGFSNLPESSQVSAISMAYQLGKENVAREWPKFMEAIKEAGQYAEGSAEQTAALAKAKFNMLYNVAEDGAVTATKWATQTADRAMRMAEGMAADVAENIEAAGGAIIESIIPKAEASDLKPAIIGEKPEAEAVAAIATAKNPADVAYQYLGIDENTEEGALAVKGFFENVVGDWNPDDQSVEEFAASKAWCAAFLTQVLRDSGVDTRSLLGKDKFNQVRAASYLKAGDAVEAPEVQAGDIMIKMHSAADRKKFKLGVAHVGIVAKVEGDTVYFIGGNTGDKVELSDYNMTEEDVSFRRIKGASDIPSESLPSMLQLKAGKYGRKAMDKISKGFNSIYDNVFGE